jgi:hypothetical protein
MTTKEHKKMHIRDLILVLKGYNKFNYLGCLALAEYILKNDIKDIDYLIEVSSQYNDISEIEEATYKEVLSCNNSIIVIAD